MQIYSNGLSEIILGNAIKKLNIPREEVVVLTKVCSTVTRSCAGTHDCFFRAVPQVFGPVAPRFDMNPTKPGTRPHEIGVVLQRGLNRKVRFGHALRTSTLPDIRISREAHLRRCEGELEEVADGLH